ncbi:MAG: hypothetical protein IT372_23580 [Polyangiaceae bacterium]|nr:hypothetical protein [Polyangiaceae bacterium]
MTRCFAAGAVGCGGDDSSPGGPGTGGAGGAGAGGSGAGGSGPGGSGTGGSGTGGAGGNASGITCATEPPPGAAVAPPPPAYSGGACPALADGMNTLPSSGADRQFRLVLPANLDPAERLPVIFLWHWLGGSADDFYNEGDIQAAADSQRFIAVIPESKGDVLFKWPFEATQTQARVDEELLFFDDMLACVAEQFSINTECVGSAGVRAGALFTDQLAGGRGDRLSSIISLSGGVDGVVRPWTQPDHKMPALVLWGGPTDECFGVLNFEDASHSLEAGLSSGGHFFLECVHNCGHAKPPLDVPAGAPAFAPLWRFFLDHPYWLNAGNSPYIPDGIPAELPSWCAIGQGSSTPRTGACPDPPGC